MPPPLSPAHGSGTGVYVSTAFSLYAALLVFFPPTVVIDGKRHHRSWGVHFYPLRPGRHTVEVYYSHPLGSRCGYAATDIVVRDGSICRLFYLKEGNENQKSFDRGTLRNAGPGPVPKPSAKIKMAWILIIVAAVTVLASISGLGAVGLVMEVREAWVRAEQEERHRQFQGQQMDPTEVERVFAENEAARLREKEQLGERAERTDLARDFMGRVNAGEIDAAYAMTSAAFRGLTDRQQFRDLVERQGLMKEKTTPEASAEQPDGAGGYRTRFFVHRPFGVYTKITVSVGREGEGWKVAQLDIQDVRENEYQQEMVVPRVQQIAAVFVSTMRLDAKWAYGMTTATFQERVSRQEFDELISGHAVLGQKPELVEGKAVAGDEGFRYEYRFRGQGGDDGAAEFSVTLIKDRGRYPVDRLTFDRAPARVNP